MFFSKQAWPRTVRRLVLRCERERSASFRAEQREEERKLRDTSTTAVRFVDPTAQTPFCPRPIRHTTSRTFPCCSAHLARSCNNSLPTTDTDPPTTTATATATAPGEASGRRGRARRGEHSASPEAARRQDRQHGVGPLLHAGRGLHARERGRQVREGLGLRGVADQQPRPQGQEGNQHVSGGDSLRARGWGRERRRRRVCVWAADLEALALVAFVCVHCALLRLNRLGCGRRHRLMVLFGFWGGVE